MFVNKKELNLEFSFLVQAVFCKDFIHRWWLLSREPNEAIEGKAVFCWQFIVSYQVVQSGMK